jgi:hypothetical protein
LLFNVSPYFVIERNQHTGNVRSWEYGQSGAGIAATASALSPTGGNKNLALAAVYTNDAYKVTTDVRYTKLGETTATVGVAQTPVASFTDNSAVSGGVSVAYTF